MSMHCKHRTTRTIIGCDESIWVHGLYRHSHAAKAAR
jgi:hypothetical protein